MKFDRDELTIYEVESLHKDLLKEFEKGNLLLDISGVNRVDMSVIQLFLSAKKSCMQSSKSFEIKGANGEVTKLFVDAGCASLLGPVDERRT